MLMGLIPLFIGLALLIIYYLMRKEEKDDNLSMPDTGSGPPELSEQEMGVETLEN
jgi:hypothetical protein